MRHAATTRRQPSLRRQARGGYAMLLVLIALAIATSLGMSAVLSGAPSSAIASNARHAGDARGLAESALEMAIAMASDGNGFRTAYSHGAWSADQPFAGGSFKVRFEDPQDSDLADDPSDDVKITVLAESNGRTHEVAALLSPPEPKLSFEVGKAMLDATPKAITFQSNYQNPVVVCTVNNDQNAETPVVVRVRNVTPTGFEAYLQNPGDLETPVADEVHFLVMEQGAHEFDGVKVEAWTIESTTTDHKGATDAVAAHFLHAYDDPVVLGQVMTTNDPDWSVFWARGAARSNPPTPTTLRIGKHVAEDTDTDRADETLGVVVFESGSHTIGGVRVEAFVSDREVEGIDTNGNRHDKVDYPQSIDDKAKFAVVSAVGLAGSDLGWPVLANSNPLSSKHHIQLAIDEDQITDDEREHGAERVAVVAFADMPSLNHGSGLKVLMAVDDADDLNTDEEDRLDLLQSWGMAVTLIDNTASTPATISAMEDADVVYLCSTTKESAFKNLIDDMAVPFVSEHEALVDDLGIASSAQSVSNLDRINVIDDGHPASAGLSVGIQGLTYGSQYLNRLTGTLAPGLRVLAERPYNAGQAMFAVLESGAERVSGGPSPSRRVQLPWGQDFFEFNVLRDEGKLILRNSLEWAASDPTADSSSKNPARIVWIEPSE